MHPHETIKAAAKVLADLWLDDKWNAAENIFRAFGEGKTTVALFTICELSPDRQEHFAEWFASNV